MRACPDGCRPGTFPGCPPAEARPRHAYRGEKPRMAHAASASVTGFLDQVILPAGLVVRGTDACSGKLSFLPNSRCNKARLMTACTATVATDRYQTARIENPGSRERTAAGVAKMRRRAAELPSGGQVLPSA